jgi:polyadenylate-binding protein
MLLFSFICSQELMEGVPPQAPRASASLYVGDLPVDLPNPEDALFSLFNKVGMVISIKVCRDINTQRSLGYAYVNFQAPADADRAIETLNYTDIIPNHQIRIMWSSRDPSQRRAGVNNLFVKNIDPTISTRALRDAFAVFGAITSCKIAMDENGNSRGYGFVQFEKEDSWEKAQALDGTVLGAQPLSVKKFIKKSDREAEAAKTFVTVFIKNIKGSATQEEVSAEVSKFGEIKEIFVSPHSQHPTKFALVTLATHENAVAVISNLNDSEGILSEAGVKLYVVRAQKKTERQKIERQSQNLYQSQGRNIYVKHLDDAITKEKLEELFQQFGKVTSCALMKDASGNFRGFGFVCFDAKESAAAAIREMNGKQIFRRPLYVSQAQQRDMRHQVLDEQRRSMMAQQQRFNQQMNMYGPPGPWNRYPPMPPQFMPPFMMNGPGPMRRPPMPRMPMPGPMNPRMNMMPMRPANLSQQPRAYTQPQPQRPVQGVANGMSAQNLAKMTPEEQKNALGERLYSKIMEVNPSQAAKITGMLLEMETGEILNVLEDPRLLVAKVNEAVTVLQQHESNIH